MGGGVIRGSIVEHTGREKEKDDSGTCIDLSVNHLPLTIHLGPPSSQPCVCPGVSFGTDSAHQYLWRSFAAKRGTQSAANVYTPKSPAKYPAETFSFPVPLMHLPTIPYRFDVWGGVSFVPSERRCPPTTCCGNRRGDHHLPRGVRLACRRYRTLCFLL